MAIIDRLVEAKNSVIVSEHQLDVMRFAPCAARPNHRVAPAQH
jgi:excinuclease UvrABC ATPase subunit